MIKDFILGQSFTEFFIIRDIQIKTTAQGKPYLSAKLIDCSGDIDFKLWDYSGELTPNDNGRIVKVRGTVTNYRDTLQINGELIRLVVDTDNYDKTNLVPSAPIDAKEYADHLEYTINSLQDTTYREICMAAWTEFKDDFIIKPAAKGVHHAFVNGLLMHTFNMVKLASTISLLYSKVIDQDLLLAGTILHDIGKLIEYSFDANTNLVTGFSYEGELLGHLVIGAGLVDKFSEGKQLDPRKVILLKHMLLSHHGKPDYGAAVVPKTLEAELLHFIDSIDAKVELCSEIFDKTPLNTFAEKHFALDNRSFYKHYEHPGSSISNAGPV